MYRFHIKFSHALVRLHHFTKRDVWDHKISLTSPYFIEVPVRSQESEWPCICMLGVSISIGFGNGSHSVLFCVFHFIHTGILLDIFTCVA